jgi:hypothetical protein
MGDKFGPAKQVRIQKRGYIKEMELEEVRQPLLIGAGSNTTATAISVNAPPFRVYSKTTFIHAVLADAMERFGWGVEETADFLDLSMPEFMEMLTMKSVPAEFSEQQHSDLLFLTGMELESLFPGHVINMITLGCFAGEIAEIEFGPRILEEPGVINELSRLEVSSQILEEAGLPHVALRTPFQCLYDCERTQALNRICGSRLNPTQQKVLDLLYCQDLHPQEVARQLDMTPGYVAQVHSSVLQTLRSTDVGAFVQDCPASAH